MKTLEATFRIVTPMFLGNADQRPDDGIRPPSVKGALRFWWRALNWGRFRGTPGASDDSALKALHAEEARLFGLVAKTENGRQVGGQGSFLLIVRHNKLKTTEKSTVHPGFKPTRQKKNNDGKMVPDETHLAASRYLGYGLMTAFTSKDKETGKTKSHAGQLDRGCLNEGQIFIVTLTFRENVDVSVLKALKALGLLGSLGSRSRHGMGSIALESLKGGGIKEWEAPANAEEYDAKVKELFSGTALPATDPQFSAFWSNSRILRLLSSDTPYEVLDQFGEAMLMYRSWGKYNRVLGKPHEKRFEKDHHWYKPPAGYPASPNFHPERVEFGLPHNYHKNHHHVISENYERRSSPLLFHIHPVGNQFIGVGIYLPAQFLPRGEKIKADGKLVPAAITWSVITNFLDGKIGDTPASPKPTAPARFPAKKAVLP